MCLQYAPIPKPEMRIGSSSKGSSLQFQIGELPVKWADSWWEGLVVGGCLVGYETLDSGARHKSQPQ